MTEFIAARPVPADELRARLHEVAAMLRAIHAGPPLPTEFSPFELTARYERTARERGGDDPGRPTPSCGPPPTRSRRSWAGRACPATTTC